VVSITANVTLAKAVSPCLRESRKMVSSLFRRIEFQPVRPNLRCGARLVVFVQGFVGGFVRKNSHRLPTTDGAKARFSTLTRVFVL
jgi:hypothetical protein